MMKKIGLNLAKLREKNSTLSLLNILIIILGIIFIAHILNIILDYLNFWPLKQDNTDSFINTVWQIQATISTLPLAVFGLLIGLSNKKLYGFNVLQFILIEKKRYIAFQDILVIILFINVLQYYFTATQKIAAVCFLFLSSMFLLVLMVYEAMYTILFEEEVEEEIENHIISLSSEYIKKEEESK